MYDNITCNMRNVGGGIGGSAASHARNSFTYVQHKCNGTATPMDRSKQRTSDRYNYTLRIARCMARCAA
jgi:hypothetical protein